MKVALLQIMPGKTISENIDIGVDACKRAKKMGADIALFPEMWSNGYCIDLNIDNLKKQALSLKSEFINIFKQLAKDLEMAIAITFLEESTSLPKNSVVIFDRFGEMVLKYSKVHTCDFGDEKVISSGDDFYVTTLNTSCGNVNIGCMICYDREFPESARILMLKGAEIILVPNACPMEINRISQLRGRAYENMLGIATCNYPLGKPDCNGHSNAFDGVAYLPDLEGSRDMLLIEASEEEGVYVVDFDLDLIRTYRETEVHGNAYRRPRKYLELIKEEIKYPFIRNNYRK